MQIIFDKNLRKIKKMEKIITLDKSNIDKEHICCAISDKKCKNSYELKKDWLRKEFDNGSVDNIVG